MKILLDTHIVLWSVLESSHLKTETKEVLLSSDNEIFYSVISLWEVSLKHSINPKSMEISASEFRNLCQESGFIELSVEYMHILGLDSLVQKENYPIHRDPFDRILLSQSIAEGMMFLTHASKIATFDSNNILLV